MRTGICASLKKLCIVKIYFASISGLAPPNQYNCFRTILDPVNKTTLLIRLKITNSNNSIMKYTHFCFMRNKLSG